jgi:fluoroquinolone transport system permease protein
MRIWSAINYDIRFQLRHGFYYAYALVSVLYILLLRLLPIDIREYITTLIVFSDPSVLGFFFIGGIVLMEKSQNIFESLFVTPFKAWEYLISKVISLTLIAVISSVLIVTLSVGFQINFVALILGVALSSIFFTLLGFTLAFLAKSINQYLIASVLYVPIFMLPVLEFLGLYKTPLFNLIPAKPALILIKGAFNSLTGLDYLYSIGVLAIWIVIAYIWANSWFYKYVILRIGGGGK